MPRENLLSLFVDFAKYSSDIAVVQRRGYRRESWTYADLMRGSILCAQALQRRGVRSGDRVMLWAPNSAQWMAAFWGCLLRGAVAVPLDEGAMPQFAARVAKDAGVALLLAGRAKPQLDGDIPRAGLEDFAVTENAKDDSLGRVPRGTTIGALADEPITASHVAQILFTSGTTAEPRGVVLTHGNFLANIEPLERGIAPYRKWERWFHPLRFVSVVPLSHVFGQFMSLFVPPLLGATVVFEDAANPAEIIRTLKRERATALIAVPRQLELLRGAIERQAEAGSGAEMFAKRFNLAKGKKFLRRAWIFRDIHFQLGWKFWAFICGGAALGADTEEFFRRPGYAVVQGYGMTETASLISLNHPFRAAENSVGKVLPGREFRLAEDGEILVRGNNVASGYWQGGHLFPSTEKGWLHTGDLGELDASGNLRFRGRKKSVIITAAGLNIYPEDLEAALRAQPGVRDCVVLPSLRRGNSEPLAVLLVDDASSANAAAIVAQANSSLSEFQRVRDWLVWPEPDFPRTPTGKPRLKEISSRVENILSASSDGDSSIGGSTHSANAVADLVANFRSHASTENGSDEELNLTSLDRVELMSALEQKFHVELNETSFAQAQTVAEVQRLIAQPAAKRAEYSYPRWAQHEFIRAIRLAIYYLLVWPATQILAHPKIVGGDNLRNVNGLRNLNGPALFVSNHITRRADIGLIYAALPLRYRHRLSTAMGGETLRNMRHPPNGWFFAKRWAYQAGYWLATALFNVFPLPQYSGFRESFRFAGESVDRGYSLLVFPEGVVNDRETPDMAPFQSGIGLLAENLRIPIVPMRLDGVWQMKQERRRLAHAGEITVRIGAPVTFTPGTPAEEIAEKLQSLVRSL
jgi:long-chain acyl-CoA synthetase